MRSNRWSRWVVLGLVLLAGSVGAQDTLCNQTIGEVWNHIGNFADLGGDWNTGLYGYDWPGNDTLLPNNYLWGSYFLVGAKVEGQAYVTATSYPFTLGEWYPEEMSCGPGISDYDVVTGWHDEVSNPRNPAGRHLGVRVIFQALTWASEPLNDIVFYIIGLTYNPDQCDIPGHGDFLDSLYLGILFDCDVSGPSATQPHMDDMVWFDGWVHGEWPGYPFDSLTILPDTFLQAPDGYPDQYTVYGDDPWEHTLHGEIEVVPRNTSYMWDDDNPETPGNDAGEDGASAGYIGLRLLYAPPTPSDSLWVDAYGDSARIPRVSAHQWWNWDNVPATDADFYLYLKGEHPALPGYHFAPLPYVVGEGPFDYRFLQSSGPHRLYAGDTLWFVFAGAVGQGLNGGYDDYYGRGWLRGLRQTLDYALAAYYAGSVTSDPYHPSGPFEDAHWVGVEERASWGSPTPNWLKLATLQRGPWLTLEVHGVRQGTVTLYDLTGRRILSWAVHRVDSAPSVLRLPVGELPAGIYLVRLQAGNRGVTKKVILLNNQAH